MKIDIEKEFSRCVRDLGGQVLGEALEQPTFANADYWFPEHGVVAKLKCLEVDVSSGAEFKEEASRLYASWIQKGLVPPTTASRVTFNLRNIPQICAYEYLEVIKKRFESSTIRKANRQLRETKEFLGAQDARGLLVLANDGNLTMKPDLVAHLLARIVKDKHTSIDTIIYFAPNHEVKAPIERGTAHFWIHAVVSSRNQVPYRLCAALEEKWMSRVAALTGLPVYRFGMPNTPEIVETMTFINRTL